MRVLFLSVAALLLSFAGTQTVHADYKLPLEGAFASITNYFVSAPTRPAPSPFSIDEVPSPMASEIDKVYFQGRLDGLFCSRFIKERRFKDCSTCCSKNYSDLVGHDGLAGYPTDLKSYYLQTCNRNCSLK